MVAIVLIASINCFSQESQEYGSSEYWSSVNSKKNKTNKEVEVMVTTKTTNETIPNLKPFENVASGLYVSKVIELPNKTQKDILTQFKNWASTSFVSLKEVIVSETENQIVLVYITEPTNYIKMLGTKSFYDTKHYVRMIIQSKDGKCKISIFDDGNVYKIGQYAGNIKIPDTPARSVYFSKMDLTNKPQDLHKRDGFMWGVFFSWQTKVESMIESCEKGLKDSGLITNLNDDF